MPAAATDRAGATVHAEPTVRAGATVHAIAGVHARAAVSAGARSPEAASGSLVTAADAARRPAMSPRAPVHDRPVAGVAGPKARLWSVHCQVLSMSIRTLRSNTSLP